MALALLALIAIEPVIPELDPSLVMLGLGSAKQVTEGVNYAATRRQCVANTLSFG